MVRKVALGSNWSGQTHMVKGVDDLQELFVISVRIGQILDLGEARHPFFRPGVLEVVGWDPKAHESLVALWSRQCI